MAVAPDTTPTVSIVLVTYNGWAYTRRCLDRLLAGSFAPGLEVIVVDNASSDDTTAGLRTRYPSVRLVECGYNAGFGTACNRGLEVAQGEFCVLLNNDALLDPDQLDELLRAYRAQGLHGIYTARIVDENGREEPSCFRDISPNALLLDTFLLMSTALRRHSVALEGRGEEALEVDACSGAFWLMPRSLWCDTGGFDERFFMYYEDIELCRRARAMGYRCYVNTRITIRHACGGSAMGNLRRARAVDRSQRLFYRKHFGRWGALRCRLHQVLRSAPRALVHGLLGVSADHRQAGLMHWALAWDALTSA